MILNMKETNKDVLSTNCDSVILFLATSNHDLCTLTIHIFAIGNLPYSITRGVPSLV